MKLRETVIVKATRPPPPTYTVAPTYTPYPTYTPRPKPTAASTATPMPTLTPDRAIVALVTMTDGTVFETDHVAIKETISPSEQDYFRDKSF